jgi:hypothetical protein
MKITIELETIGDAWRVIQALKETPDLATFSDALVKQVEAEITGAPPSPPAQKIDLEKPFPGANGPPPPPDVDAKGMPWDKRIHSRTKALKADGTWRSRRGVDAEVVKQVEAELTGAPPAPPVAEVPAPPPAPPAPVEAPKTFPEFMKWIATVDKKYTETDPLNELVAQVGLPSIGLLAVNLQHIPTLVELVKHGGA